MIKTNRGAFKYLIFSILTLGIYSIYFYYWLNRDMNSIQKKDKDYQANYIAIFVLGLITFGVVPLVWKIILNIRIYDEAKKRGVKREGNFVWIPIGQFALAWTIVCPIIAMSQMCETVNNVAEDYNEKALAEFDLTEDRFYNYTSGKAIPQSRILERHNVGSVFTGFLLIAIGLLPIITMIVPIFYMQQNVAEGMSFTPKSMFGAIDIIVSIFNSKSALAGLAADFNTFAFGPILQKQNAYISVLYYENVYAILGWFILSLLLGIGNIIVGMVLIIRGRMSAHFTPIIVTAALFFNLFLLTADVVRLGWFYSFAMNNYAKATETSATSGYFFLPIPAIAAALALIYVFAILFIYIFYFIGKTYREDVDYVEVSDKDDLEEQLRKAKNQPKPKKRLLYTDAIAAHAYEKNINIDKLTINNGIKTIGEGAFANCLRLNTINLPKSLERIEYNCFFNCASLSLINYAGTKEEWSKIIRGSNWLYKAGTKVVVCVDGAITVDPTC